MATKRKNHEPTIRICHIFCSNCFLVAQKFERNSIKNEIVSNTLAAIARARERELCESSVQIKPIYIVCCCLVHIKSNFDSTLLDNSEQWWRTKPTLQVLQTHATSFTSTPHKTTAAPSIHFLCNMYHVCLSYGRACVCKSKSQPNRMWAIEWESERWNGWTVQLRWLKTFFTTTMCINHNPPIDSCGKK